MMPMDLRLGWLVRRPSTRVDIAQPNFQAILPGAHLTGFSPEMARWVGRDVGKHRLDNVSERTPDRKSTASPKDTGFSVY